MKFDSDQKELIDLLMLHGWSKEEAEKFIETLTWFIRSEAADVNHLSNDPHNHSQQSSIYFCPLNRV